MIALPPLPRVAGLLAAALLASCAAPPAGPAPDFRIGAEAYAITRDADGWRVGQPGHTVACRAATVDDCYWSLRAMLAAEAAMDEIP